MVTMINQ